MPSSEHSFGDISETLKKVGAVLRDNQIPYLLGGSLAFWAHGGPERRKDLDFMVKPEDADRALQVLEDEGLRPEKPPEGWLYKAWDGEVLVDLIFYPKGMEIDDEVIARGEDLEVLAMPIRVMALEDVLCTKLLALHEHYVDYSGLLQMARSLREKVDWEAVRTRTAGSPFARAFFTMIEGTGIIGEGEPSEVSGRTAVRVVEPSR
ncbi:MAG TPA: nucleotidyltransferase [Thermoleophilaceae bacterium]|nr:nucleotidyltransferase [Thermoleophilaceae bacterium]